MVKRRIDKCLEGKARGEEKNEKLRRVKEKKKVQKRKDKRGTEMRWR